MLQTLVSFVIICAAIGFFYYSQQQLKNGQNRSIYKPVVVPTHDKTIYLVASGDYRLSANQKCWPAQHETEQRLEAALKKFGYVVKRAHPYNEQDKHGFVHSQRMGMNVFQNIPKHARVIVAEAVWQYSHHVLAGLRDHEGPILVCANWSGQWPGLVGALNLCGSMTKINKPYNLLWSVDFTDEWFVKRLQEWLNTGHVTHDYSHVQDLSTILLQSTNKPQIAQAVAVGKRLAQSLKQEKAIMGVFDEGCMGMENAIIDDQMMNPLGIFKERLSQSALVAAMRLVSDAEAQQVRNWLSEKGMKFNIGPNPATDLTEEQILEQCKMYVAALRMANEYSCDAIGIQYQIGLKDMTAASDLVEGILNNVDRPPVYADGKELFAGNALPHFNEADEGSGVDMVISARVWKYLNFDASSTLHDVRYGEYYKDDKVDAFVWVFEISGSAPPNHFINGWKGAIGERQPSMYFPKGGSSLKGISKPGHIVWSRVFVQDNALHCDIGLGTVVELPQKETERRWNMTTSQWPIMHAILDGVSQNQMMGKHKANHIQVYYVPSAQDAKTALLIKAAMMSELGVQVNLCGAKSVLQ